MKSKTSDTYAILEFQGLIRGTPYYNPAKKELSFKAGPVAGPILSFVAKGELAKSAKSYLRAGLVVRMTASPSVRLITLLGEKYRLNEWEAQRIEALGRYRFKLPPFEDLYALDGLMPEENIYKDVGRAKE